MFKNIFVLLNLAFNISETIFTQTRVMRKQNKPHFT